MTLPIKPLAILLDLDGTLADSLPAMRRAYGEFLRQLKIEPTDAEFDSLNGPTLEEIVHRLSVSHRLGAEEPQLLAIYLQIVAQSYADVSPNPGAEYLLEKARSNACTVGIVTSNSTRCAEDWLVAARLSHRVDFVVSGDDVAHGKPHPEPYVMAAARAQRAFAKIVAVEDSPQGAQSAVSAGLKTFVLTREFGRHSWPDGVTAVGSLATLADELW
jgi:HAD superfamily hydrolase (TIGR01509 family)